MRAVAAALMLIVAMALPLPAVRAAGLDCAALQVRDCIATRGCVLDCTNTDKLRCSPYVCRPARNACEGSMPQQKLTHETCVAIGRCMYQAPGCFCPGPALCVCGGGPPPRCMEKPRRR